MGEHPRRAATLLILAALCAVGCRTPDAGPSGPWSHAEGSETRGLPIAILRPALCLIDHDGALYCGSRAVNERPDALQLVGMWRADLPRPVESVATGWHRPFLCAVLVGGQVWCVGGSLGGQVPIPEGGIYSSIERHVPLDGPAVEIAAGYARACARLVDGRVSCWGHRVLPSARPVRLVRDARGRPIRSMTSIAVDVGIDDDGQVWAWGQDRFGLVTRQPPRQSISSLHEVLLPAQRVPGVPRAVAVASTSGRHCIITASASREVFCWGRPGPVDPLDEWPPIRSRPEGWFVRGLPPARSITCARLGCLVVAEDGGIYEVSGAQAQLLSRVEPGLDVHHAVGTSGAGCASVGRGVRCWGGLHPQLSYAPRWAPVALPSDAPSPARIGPASGGSR